MASKQMGLKWKSSGRNTWNVLIPEKVWKQEVQEDFHDGVSLSSLSANAKCGIECLPESQAPSLTRWRWILRVDRPKDWPFGILTLTSAYVVTQRLWFLLFFFTEDKLSSITNRYDLGNRRDDGAPYPFLTGNKSGTNEKCPFYLKLGMRRG